jgi:hypothetical protein
MPHEDDLPDEPWQAHHRCLEALQHILLLRLPLCFQSINVDAEEDAGYFNNSADSSKDHHRALVMHYAMSF